MVIAIVTLKLLNVKVIPVYMSLSYIHIYVFSVHVMCMNNILIFVELKMCFHGMSVNEEDLKHGVSFYGMSVRDEAI